MKSSIFNKKHLILLIVLFTLAISFSLFLNSNPGIEETDTTPTIEEYNKIYSEVIEQNKKTLENPVEYGDKYCSGYISVKNDFELHISILN